MSQKKVRDEHPPSLSKRLLMQILQDRPIFPGGNSYWQDLVGDGEKDFKQFSWQGLRSHFRNVALRYFDDFVHKEDIEESNFSYLQELRTKMLSREEEYTQKKPAHKRVARRARHRPYMPPLGNSDVQRSQQPLLIRIGFPEETIQQEEHLDSEDLTLYLSDIDDEEQRAEQKEISNDALDSVDVSSWSDNDFSSS
jgi:hypothetical protein